MRGGTLQEAKHAVHKGPRPLQSLLLHTAHHDQRSKPSSTRCDGLALDRAGGGPATSARKVRRCGFRTEQEKAARVVGRFEFGVIHRVVEWWWNLVRTCGGRTLIAKRDRGARDRVAECCSECNIFGQDQSFALGCVFCNTLVAICCRSTPDRSLDLPKLADVSKPTQRRRELTLSTKPLFALLHATSPSDSHDPAPTTPQQPSHYDHCTPRTLQHSLQQQRHHVRHPSPRYPRHSWTRPAHHEHSQRYQGESQKL